MTHLVSPLFVTSMNAPDCFSSSRNDLGHILRCFVYTKSKPKKEYLYLSTNECLINMASRNKKLNDIQVR